MSTRSKKVTKVDERVQYSLSMHELGEVVAKHFGLTEGYYDLMLEFKIGFGAAGPTPEDQLPSAIIGVSKIGLVQTDPKGELTIKVLGTKNKNSGA